MNLRTLTHIPLGILQLARRPLRLAVAALGVVFAVVLILMQLAFRDAMFASAVELHRHFDAGLVLISRQYTYLGDPNPFSLRRLHQARGIRGVASVHPLYARVGEWRNPEARVAHKILVVGIDPADPGLAVPRLDEQLPRLRVTDTLLLDAASRPQYGVDPAVLTDGRSRRVELDGHAVSIDGTFDLGASFAIDGNVLTSRRTFLRAFPYQREGTIDIGLVRLQPGVDVEAVRRELRAALPPDVDILTTQDFIAREQEHWRRDTPIGYAFTFGVVVAFFVGAVVVYQVLFVSVSDRLHEYATLKALGFPDEALFTVVLQQGVVLALLGFLPGVVLCDRLCAVAAGASALPVALSLSNAVRVFGLTLLMCCVSGVAALHKVRAADPAEVFA